MTDTERIVFDTLFKEYEAMVLTKEQMAKVCNISIRTLDRHRECSKGCEYRFVGGRVYYPLDKVVSYLSKHIQTFN